MQCVQLNIRECCSPRTPKPTSRESAHAQEIQPSRPCSKQLTLINQMERYHTMDSLARAFSGIREAFEHMRADRKNAPVTAAKLLNGAVCAPAQLQRDVHSPPALESIEIRMSTRIANDRSW